MGAVDEDEVWTTHSYLSRLTRKVDARFQWFCTPFVIISSAMVSAVWRLEENASKIPSIRHGQIIFVINSLVFFRNVNAVVQGILIVWLVAISLLLGERTLPTLANLKRSA
jgi:hypothetical protein